jgi:formamidopyrimidine-DNA glycosylase
MPELPEVETIVTDLKKVIPGLKITDVWSDIPVFQKIKKEVIGRKILGIERRGKNILIGLSQNTTLLIHLKLTGHLLYRNSQNRFIHLILFLSNGKQLVLSDLRKFAKVLVWPTNKLGELKDINKLGPEPLSPIFTFKKFREILKNKRAAKGEPRQRRGKIKTVLMNQEVISGIGNIYSDEILWEAGIHPLKRVEKINDEELKKIFRAIKKILKRAIKAKGDSFSNYRRPSGEKGFYQEIQNAYGQEGIKCKKRDGGIIKRIKIGGRSAHFCPLHQKL